MLKEVWQNINELQSISNKGNVKYHNFIISIIPISPNGIPYIQIDGVNTSIQSLVVKYFMNIEYKHIVRHIDGNKLNNTINNLSIEYLDDGTHYIFDAYNPNELMDGEKLRFVNLKDVKKIAVTNFGRVYNCATDSFTYGSYSDRSYNISSDLSNKTPVSELVYYTFHPEEYHHNEMFDIKHIDGNYSNNRLENLTRTIKDVFQYTNSRYIYQYDSKTGVLLNKWYSVRDITKHFITSQVTVNKQLRDKQWSDFMTYVWMDELVDKFHEIVDINTSEFVFVYSDYKIKIFDGYSSIGFTTSTYKDITRKYGACFEKDGIIYSKYINKLIERIEKI